jgi:hypothetical protein
MSPEGSAVDPPVTEERRLAMLEEMTRRRQEVAVLSRALAQLDGPSRGAAGHDGDAQALRLAAEITKHRISIALLIAQLRRRAA